MPVYATLHIVIIIYIHYDSSIERLTEDICIRLKIDLVLVFKLLYIKVSKKKKGGIMKDQQCPYCKIDEVNRIPLELWMNFLPGCKRYVCSSCKSEFVVILGDIIISLTEGYSELTNINLGREVKVI
jgi:hypothetical protein